MFSVVLHKKLSFVAESRLADYDPSRVKRSPPSMNEVCFFEKLSRNEGSGDGATRIFYKAMPLGDHDT